MTKPLRQIAFLIVVLVFSAAAFAQEVETVDGVRVVHNEKGGLWGKAPKVSLELVRKIGDVDTEDEHFAFNFPSGVTADKDGNVYVLDSANARVQKFGPDGQYLATIGRKGQGPGEFIMPDSIEFVGKASTYAIPRPGQPAKSVADMRLFRRIAADGKIAGSFGRLTDLGESMTSAMGNAVEFDVAADGALLVSFNGQNRIEKYAPDGTLVWRADRPLAYGTEVKKKGKMEQRGGGFMISGPEMNDCAAGIAVDAKGRAWVVTYARQLRENEKVQTSIMMSGGQGGGVSSASVKTEGNTDVRTTDAFKLEIFDRDGVLLGEIPITHFADVIRIAGDRLFLIDRERGVTVYEYKIVEK